MIAVCIGSAGFGFWRGFAQEALSIVTWLAAIWLAWRFAWMVEPLLGDWVVAPELKIWVARAAVFIVILIAGGLIARSVRELVWRSVLGGTDRILGSLFGFARGVLIVGLVVVILQFSGLDQNPWWQEAMLSPLGERIADGIRYYAALGSRYL
jgi:membrane protein required for colicin V production